MRVGLLDGEGADAAAGADAADIEKEKKGKKVMEKYRSQSLFVGARQLPLLVFSQAKRKLCFLISFSFFVYTKESRWCLRRRSIALCASTWRRGSEFFFSFSML